MNDIEQLQMMDLEEQLKFARNQVVELKKEIARLTALLNGEDVFMNSIKTTTDNKNS